MSLHRLPYRPDWDGIRALAILGVVFCHAEVALAGGFIGVDVFFVLSGFLISKLIFKDMERGNFSIVAFWERRLRRILPALIVVTTSSLVAGYLVMAPDAYQGLGRSAIALVGMVSNFYFWWDTGYFSEEADYKPLLHTWSLGIEEQFYFLIVVGLVLLTRFGQLRKAAWWVGGLSLASLGISIWGASHESAAAFFLLPGRAWELGTGSLLAMASPVLLPRLVREIMGFFGLGILLFCAVLYDGHTLFPGWAAIPPVFATCLLLWPNPKGSVSPLFQRFLSLPPLAFLGKISYPLYLWHWPHTAFLNYWSFDPPEFPSRIGVLLLGLALSILTYYFVEAPFRNRAFVPTPNGLLRYATVAGLLVVCAGNIIVNEASKKLDQPLQQNLVHATTQRVERYLPNHSPGQTIDNMARFGDETETPEVLVWGDSHAMAVLPAIESLCQLNNTTALAATRFLTPPIGAFRQDDEDTFNQLVLEFLEKSRIHPVILASRWSSYLSNDSEHPRLLETVDRLHELGIRVFFLMDVPNFSYHVPRIMSMNLTRKFEIHRLGVSLSEHEQANACYLELVPELAKRGVGILDPLPYFVRDENPELLLPFDAKGVFYRDADHLSVHGAMSIRDVFNPVFD
jgi:peptidoglycan/LPS O-acetylase OafA/YrhL